ncbi:MAG TPA: hypothetical protein VIG99_31790 [Myxococcaceae bacterium]
MSANPIGTAIARRISTPPPASTPKPALPAAKPAASSFHSAPARPPVVLNPAAVQGSPPAPPKSPRGESAGKLVNVLLKPTGNPAKDMFAGARDLLAQQQARAANGESPVPADNWDYRCLSFVGTVARSAGINDPRLNVETPIEVIANVGDDLHPMSETPPIGAVVLWDQGGYYDANGEFVQTGHAAIYAGTNEDGEPLYITTTVDGTSGLSTRTITSLQADENGQWNPTPPVGWFIPENP